MFTKSLETSWIYARFFIYNIDKLYTYVSVHILKGGYNHLFCTYTHVVISPKPRKILTTKYFKFILYISCLCPLQPISNDVPALVYTYITICIYTTIYTLIWVEILKALMEWRNFFEIDVYIKQINDIISAGDLVTSLYINICLYHHIT